MCIALNSFPLEEENRGPLGLAFTTNLQVSHSSHLPLNPHNSRIPQTFLANGFELLYKLQIFSLSYNKNDNTIPKIEHKINVFFKTIFGNQLILKT